MIRFLHLSDVHLNTGFASKSSYVRNQLKEALYEAIIKAVNYIVENELEGMILAGDFFDDDKISFQDEHFVLHQFKRILENGQKIFYVTGNHDPMLTARFLEPLTKHASFYFFDDDIIKCLDITSRNGTSYKVVGVGHKSKNEQRDLIVNYPRRATDEIWVGIAHASVPSAIDITDKARYMATPLTHIEALDYNYFALGHIHIRQLLTQKIGYSGNLQGLNIKETGLKGGFLVTIETHSTKVEPVDFSRIRWEQCELTLTPDIKTLSELQELIVDHVSHIIGTMQSAAKQMIMRLNLKGQSTLKNQIEEASNCAYLSELVKDRTGLLDLEIKSRNLFSPYDVDALTSEHTLLSQMLKRISMDTYEPELLSKIYALPIFDNEITQTRKENYLQEMKTFLIQEVIDRMVVKTDEN